MTEIVSLCKYTNRVIFMCVCIYIYIHRERETSLIIKPQTGRYIEYTYPNSKEQSNIEMEKKYS